MYFHNHDERTLGPLDDETLPDEWFWNLWSKRLQPYDQLMEGDSIGLVVTDQSGSAIRFIVTVHDVLQATYATRREAYKQLSAHTGIRTADLAANPYTAAQPERSGFLLSWRAGQIRRVDLPRPSELALWRHGWGREDDPVRLADWGIGGRTDPTKKPASGRGQGWQTSVEANRAVEQHAMDVAYLWLVEAGYPYIEDVSARKSWDYEARRTPAGPIRHVEIKGTITPGLDCLVTRNEVDAALAAPGASMLLAVNSIRLQRLPKGVITASGGELHAYDPWTPTNAELRAQTYRWRPASISASTETDRPNSKEV